MENGPECDDDYNRDSDPDIEHEDTAADDKGLVDVNKRAGEKKSTTYDTLLNHGGEILGGMMLLAMVGGKVYEDHYTVKEAKRSGIEATLKAVAVKASVGLEKHDCGDEVTMACSLNRKKSVQIAERAGAFLEYKDCVDSFKPSAKCAQEEGWNINEQLQSCADLEMMNGNFLCCEELTNAVTKCSLLLEREGGDLFKSLGQ